MHPAQGVASGAVKPGLTCAELRCSRLLCNRQNVTYFTFFYGVWVYVDEITMKVFAQDHAQDVRSSNDGLRGRPAFERRRENDLSTRAKR